MVDGDRMLAFEHQHVVANPGIKMAAAKLEDLEKEEQELAGDVVVCSRTGSFPDLTLQSQCRSRPRPPDIISPWSFGHRALDAMRLRPVGADTQP